jgi:F-type H+-transporting ATPase subunit b
MEFLRDPEVWIAVAFVLFVVLAGRPIVRGIGKTLDERSTRIRADLDEAERLRREAEALLAEYTGKLQAAATETARIVGHAREEAETMRSEAAAALEATLARRQRMALDKIAQAEAQALAEVRGQAVDLAVAAAARILQQQMAGPRAGELIDQSIVELERKLH